jgi:hypothetical protein
MTNEFQRVAEETAAFHKQVLRKKYGQKPLALGELATVVAVVTDRTNKQEEVCEKQEK